MSGLDVNSYFTTEKFLTCYDLHYILRGYFFNFI